MKDKRKTFYVEENNSGGFTKYLCCSIEAPDKKKRYHIVKILAKDIDDMIEQFEKVFGCDWDYENSYEGNSCNCCGRRFIVEMLGDGNNWIDGIRGYDEIKDTPYRWKEGEYNRAEIVDGKLKAIKR